MRSTKIGLSVLCALVLAALIVLAGDAGAVAGPQADAIELRNPYMDWLDVNEEGAMFEWRIDVTNNTSSPVRVQVILDLLDDDDRPINRDEQNNPLDNVIVTVEPGATLAVEQQGIIAYDRAAEVVTYRHRHRVIQ